MANQIKECSKCGNRLFWHFENETGICDACHGEQYAKDAALDNLTDKDQHEEVQ
jgi:uncharacterized protein (DUF983 family)